MTDIERARSACADAHAKVGLTAMAAGFVNGLYDDSTDVQAALAALQAERKRIVGQLHSWASQAESDKIVAYFGAENADAFRATFRAAADEIEKADHVTW